MIGAHKTRGRRMLTPSPWMSPALDDHVARVDPDPELETLSGRDTGVPLGQALLHRGAQATASTTLGNSISSPSPVVFDDAAPVLGGFSDRSGRGAGL